MILFIVLAVLLVATGAMALSNYLSGEECRWSSFWWAYAGFVLASIFFAAEIFF